MRLTKSQQDCVRKLIINNKYGPITKALAQEGYDLALKIYRTVVSKADEALADKLAEKHPGMIQIINNWALGNVNGDFRYMQLENFRPKANLPRFTQMSEEHQVSVLAHIAKLDAEKQNRDTDISLLTSMLARLNTIKKIQEEWPEIMPFVEQVVGQMIVANLPAVNKEDLNARFDLPVEDKQAA
jgi:hypothetical protein